MFQSQKTVSMPLLKVSVTAREKVEVAVIHCYDSESENIEWLWISREKLRMGMHFYSASLKSFLEDVERKPNLWWATLTSGMFSGQLVQFATKNKSGICTP